MKRERVWKDAVIGVMVLVLFITTGVKLASAQAAKTLLVGNVGPLTGPGATWGIGGVRSLELSASLINRTGGITVEGQRYDIKMIHEDDKYTGAGGVAAVNKLIYTDKVKFIVGPLATASILAFQPVTESNKVLLIVDAYGGPEMLRNKPYTFRIWSPPVHMSPALFAWLKKAYPNLKRIVHLSDNDSTGWGATQGDNDAADYVGFEVVGSEFYERGTIDFTAVLTRILPKKPDILSIGGTPEGESAQIVKQARELGYKGLIVHSGMVDPDVIGPIAGWENVEGIITTGVGKFPSPLMPESMKDFVTEYRAKFGDMNAICPHFADMLPIFRLAIQKANSLDTDKLVRVMESELGQVDSAFGGKGYFAGKKFYGSNHQFLRNILISQITKNRKLEVVGSAMALEDPVPEKKWR